MLLDTGTGVRSPIAEGIWPFISPRIATLGGNLHSVNRVTGCGFGGPPHLSTYDLEAGAFLTPAPVFIDTDGSSVVHNGVGDLTSDGTAMMMSLALCGSSQSSVLADLSPGASLTNLTDFAASGADMNGLAASPGGEIFALDWSTLSVANLYRVAGPRRTSSWAASRSRRSPCAAA